MNITTIQGDTWDTIAKRVYGDTKHTQRIMEARENIRLLDIQVFPAGLSIYAPEISEETAAYTDLPDWRK